MAIPRPSDLPDFTKPPLVEVALFTQFATPSRYREFFAADVWALFRGEFPSVQEMPAAPPVFEVFGVPAQAPVPQFGLVTGPICNRFWFISADEKELIQYQADRFVHNWRKMTADAQYPRYEAIASKYRSELHSLDKLFEAQGWGRLAANQSELTYVNQMPLMDVAGKPISPSFYFRRFEPSLMGRPASEFALNLRQVIVAGDKPVARLHVDASVQQGAGGQPQIRLTLTIRGAPTATTADASLEFLDQAHVYIVRAFVDLTSDAAHAAWGRTQ